MFRRSVIWASVFKKQKRFGQKGTGLRAGLSKIFASLFFITLVVSLLKPQPFIFISLGCFLIDIILSSNFLYFIYKEKGAWYLIRSFALLHFWSLVITMGVAFGFLKILFEVRNT